MSVKSDIIKEVLDKIASKNNNIDQSSAEQVYDALDQVLASYNIQESPKILISSDNEEIINKFINAKRVEGKSDTTLYNYRGEIIKMMVYIKKPYKDITTEDIRRYMADRKISGNLRPISVQNIRQYLMSFFKWLTKEEFIIKNPMDRIDVIKTEQKVIDVLSDEEAEMIRCACTCERDIAIVDLLSGSGMRVSELCALDRDNVNFQTKEIIVYGKGSKERICFMTGKAKVHLQWYLDQREDANPALFVTARKPYNRLSRNGVEYILRQIATDSKVDKARLYPHKYRKTFATNMIKRGAAAEHVKDILGHSSVNTTLKCYCKIDKDTIKRTHDMYA